MHNFYTALVLLLCFQTVPLQAESLEPSELVCKVSDKSFTIYKENNATNKFFAIIRTKNDREVVVDAFHRAEGSGVCKYNIWDFEYQGLSIVLDQYSINTGCWGEELPPEVGTLKIGGPEGVELLCEANSFLRKSYDQINQNLTKITGLSSACISFEYENASDSEVEWTLREVHNEQCGGDPDTAPRIATLKSFRDQINGKVTLAINDLPCACWKWLVQ